MGMERDFAAKLTKLAKPVHALLREGWDDPDDGLPGIDVHDGKRMKNVWGDFQGVGEHPDHLGRYELALSFGIVLPKYRRNEAPVATWRRP